MFHTSCTGECNRRLAGKPAGYKKSLRPDKGAKALRSRYHPFSSSHTPINGDTRTSFPLDAGYGPNYLRIVNRQRPFRGGGSKASSSFLIPVCTTHRLSGVGISVTTDKDKGSDYYSSS